MQKARSKLERLASQFLTMRTPGNKKADLLSVAAHTNKSPLMAV